MSGPLRVLLVEDSPSDAKLVIAELRKLDREIEYERVEEAPAMQAALARSAWSLILSDWSLPRFSGIEALRVVKASGLDLPFIIVSGTVGEETAVAAIREGAEDYVLKDKLGRLRAAVDRSLREHEERTARRHAEARMHEQEARFRALLENSWDVITLKNAAHELVYVSPAIERVLGFAPHEVTNRSCLGFVHPEDREAVEAHHDTLLATPGRSVNIEFRALHRNGALRWLSATETNLLADPAVAGVVGNLHDITERRRAEDALRESEARYRMIIETTNEGVWVLDEHHATTFVSGRMAAILGYTPDELVGRSVFELVDPSLRTATIAHLDKRRTGKSGYTESTLVRKDGGRRLVIIESTRIDHAEGGGTLGMVTDVTDRRVAEAALRAAETRFKRLADSGLVAICHADASGVVLDANETLATMLGYASRQAFLSANVAWRALTPPEWAERDRTSELLLRRDGVMAPYEKELLRIDGTRVPILIGGATLDDSAMVVFIIDLTAQKRAEAALQQSEQQLRQAQKMEAVGRLAGGVAHDFNNVLSVILSYADMMLDELAPGAPFHDEIVEVRTAGLRAAGLTRQLLMFSRQQVVAPEVLNLDSVIAKLERMLHRLIGEDIVLEFRPRRVTSPNRIRIDPGQLEQVIMNLAVNARDAMPQGGKLLIETEDTELDAEFAAAHLGVPQGRYVRLAVTDTGSGMDEATLSRIFEPFFTTKELGKGTGLGLATVFGSRSPPVARCGPTASLASGPRSRSTFRP
ncbi:MAG: PAS domain S-box protein [Kofleriaceae bacterium]